MQKCSTFLVLMLLSVCSLAQIKIAQWDFNALSVSPTTGAGTLIPIGGTTFTYASGTASGGSSDTAGTNNAYNTTTYPAQGTAPKTAGIQVAVSTVGYQNIQFRFDQRLSNTACNTFVVQYTTDITAAIPVWTDAQVFTFTPQALGTGDVWYNLRTANLSAVAALNNNPHAGFRVVSDFDPIAGTYLAARSTSVYSTAGTSRFDMVTVSGDSIVPPVAHQIQFIGDDATVSESAGVYTVRGIVAAAGNVSGTIDVVLNGFSNAATGADFTLGASTLNLPANAQTGDTLFFPITLLDDAVPESDEYLVLKWANGVNVNAASNDQFVVFIKDNDKLIPTASNKLSLDLVGSYSNGSAGSNSAEIVAYDSLTRRLYIANSIGAKLNIVSFSNPGSPQNLFTVDVTPYGNINSVAVHNGLVAMAIEHANPQLNGTVVFLDSNGTFLNQVPAGAMPDMITFNHAGTKVYTANEGEPNTAYTADPEGSITVVDLSAGVMNAVSTNILFTAFNAQEAALKAAGVRIFGPGATVAQDLEPEFIAISDDDTKAWVTLQENNAIAEINLLTNNAVQIYPLGTKNHDLAVNSLDATNTSTGINSARFPVKGIYMPDAIAAYSQGGNMYLFSANEGDAREYTAFSEIKRVNNASYVLDPAVFPFASVMKNNSLLGRLNITTASGDTDNDGDFDEIHAYGSRSFSVWNVTSGCSQVFDSGNELELITENHPQYANLFNASNGAGVTLKDRSDDKGPEPEGVAVGSVNNTPYIFVSLERIGGVMAYDISNPAAPQYVTYQNNRGPDLGAEGIIFIPAQQSPDGHHYVILANEISSTLSIFKVQENCAGTPSAGVPGFTSDTVCMGQSDSLWTDIALPAKGVSFQWQQNTGLGWTNVPAGNGDTTRTYITEPIQQPTQFRLIALCVNSNERDTSDVIQVELHNMPVLSVSGSAGTVCANSSVVLNAAGASTYTWSGGAINGQPVAVASSTTFTVTGTDANGCTASATYQVQVNSPDVTLGLATALNAASQTGIASDTQQHALLSTVSYYTGNCNLLATIAQNAGDLGATTVKVTVENAVLSHNGQPFVKRWFEVDPDNNSAARVYLYFTQEDFDSYNAAAVLGNWPLLPNNVADLSGMANIRITRNDSTGLGGSPQQLVPDSIAFDALNGYWVIGFNTPGFSQFRVHGANPAGAPLPVSWLRFDAREHAQGHLLEWETAHEEALRAYHVHYSADGVNFQNLGSVEPSPSSRYAFINSKPVRGINYYRIAQEDIDGQISYSPTRSLTHAQVDPLVSVYPNPTIGEAIIAFEAADGVEYSAQVADLSGRVLQQQNLGVLRGSQLHPVGLEKLPAGMYILTLRGSDHFVYTVRVSRK